MSRSRQMVLLGAGASVEAGIPAAVDLTETLIKNFRQYSRTSQVLRYVYGGLMLGKGTRGEDPLQGINVEDLIEAIILLGNRKKLQIAPFISLWNEGVAAYEERDKKDALIKALRELSQLARTPNQGGEWGFTTSALDNSVDELDQGIVLDFQHTRASVVRELIRLLWLEDPVRVGYLSRMVAQGKDAPFTIASLNYDNTIELACESLGIPCTTGLDNWNAFKGFPKPAAGIELLKLHGSVTWEKKVIRYERSKELPMPHFQIAKQSREAVRRGFEPAVIFGAGNKLTAEGPFLELLITFRQRLAKHQELIVIGYSFADEHINDAIWRWLNRDTKRTMQVIDYAEDKETDPFGKLFEYLGDRYTLHLDGAGAGIANTFRV